MSIRVRLAPSPTGPLHVGTARTALFNALFARHHGGTFLLRIEDTDRARSRPEFEQELLDGLRWLGLSWEEGPDVGGPYAPYRQSDRIPLYREALERLLREGKAYEQDSPGTTAVPHGVHGEASRTGQSAILLRVEPQDIVVEDLVRGQVRFPARELTDFVVARSLDDPLFHLAVVIDDAAMQITHVIRGEDHLSNTPRHVLLQRALGLPTPQYAHLPLLLDTQRKKLSKRTSVTGLLAYRDAGYLPEAIVNFLSLLGWNPKTTAEVFSFDELVKSFDLSGIQKGGAIFDVHKLDWLQREHLRRLTLDDLAARVQTVLERAGVRVDNRERLARAAEVWRERGGPLADTPRDLAYAFQTPVLEFANLPWRGTTPETARQSLEFMEDVTRRLPDSAWATGSSLQDAYRHAVDTAGRDRGTTLWPLRYALSGKRESPGPGELAWVLGEEEAHRRIRRALELLHGARDPTDTAVGR